MGLKDDNARFEFCDDTPRQIFDKLLDAEDTIEELQCELDALLEKIEKYKEKFGEI